ncbi:hypothetical protein BC455_18550 [Vibrio harveyi]|uniref:hypothetical protein n=1 Tax=Vibrio harveyi TaxID=669 RepID=UPI0008420265|nr:hypothetical protein [Vibrio harveyi]ODM56861.1 hypothetical protein BC455_18550 [Vibrio harveyi]
MYRAKCLLSIAVASTLMGCATAPESEVVELREYKVPKDNQIQLVASDLAVELGVAGIEWNENLKPWDYRTLRTRSIYIPEKDPQAAYLELFKDTGLLPFYREDMNRIFVEPYSTRIKVTTKFEPAFDRASQSAMEIGEKKLNQDKANGVIKDFPIYKGESVQDTLNAWAYDAGYSNIVWYIKQDAQIKALNRKHRATSSLLERSPILAIKALLENVNTHVLGTDIQYRLFPQENTIAFHSYSKDEPLFTFDVEGTDTKRNLQRLADQYGVELVYEAPIYRIKEGYRTIISSRLMDSVKHISTGYPLTFNYKSSVNTLYVGPKINE